MRVSSRSAVAIHALTKLAGETGDRLVPSAEIAESLDSNPVLVRRILGRLRDASLVVAVEGAGGGWRLARPAKEISLYDAYAAVEDGPLLAGHAHPPSQQCVVGRHIQALLETEFAEAEHALRARLGRTTIATMHRGVVELDRELGRR